jgi:hypothetical protein
VAGEKKQYAEAMRKLLNVPKNYTLVSLVAAGYPAEISLVKKKEMKNLVFFEEFKEN